jgi:hypothetical protein
MASAARFGFAVAPAKGREKTLGGTAEKAFEAALAPWRSSLSAPLLLNEDGTAGTAVLTSAEHAFDLAVALQEAAWPAPLRFTLSAAPPAGAAAKDDAVRARALKQFRGMERGAVLRADLPGRSAEECALADALARLHRTLCADWTEGRCKAVRSYRRLRRQADVANELKITQQAVSQMLLGARLRELLAAEDAMRAWLSEPRRTTLWPLKMRGMAGADGGGKGSPARA